VADVYSKLPERLNIFHANELRWKAFTVLKFRCRSNPSRSIDMGIFYIINSIISVVNNLDLLQVVALTEASLQ
jgi:hypothetical protein